ncbi:hypothetical protein OG539_19260 [Actinacidiphila glaucinigra]|uniref:hypothetical protein n=1 Tax=Actinacidiphila glaucinigra TaxID=235986 RepID=UPI002DDA5CB2|nr:hypothetical protein [Actinacidiphila glaucinigra]WSD61657.1 hypothetical protein OIE69_23515 [Actinacidiphila glaucinigra]
MRRGTTGLLGALVGLGLLCGCSPARLPLVAVWTSPDGTAVARVQPCPGDHAARMDLLSWDERESDDASADGPSGGAADSGWNMWSPARIGRTTFPLFEPPDSWQVETAGTQALLPGRTYSLSFFGPRGSDTYDGQVHFTAADLASLRPGQVWADDRAMNRAAFAELVADTC